MLSASPVAELPFRGLCGIQKLNSRIRYKTFFFGFRLFPSTKEAGDGAWAVPRSRASPRRVSELLDLQLVLALALARERLRADGEDAVVGEGELQQRVGAVGAVVVAGE